MGKIMTKSAPWFFFVIALFVLSCEKPSMDPEARAVRLGGQLRCPVCRGVPIADSPAELAKQMMQVVHEQIALGKTDEEILHYFEKRYGEWALLKPKAEGMNLSVWILPFLFILGGAVFIIIQVRKQKKETS